MCDKNYTKTIKKENIDIIRPEHY